MFSVRKTIISFFVFLLLIAGISLASVAHADDSCQQYSLPVNLSATDTTVYHIAATLCGDTHANHIQLIVPGATYSHIYWDFPYQPDHYSYTNFMTQHDETTLVIDRLGTGSSDHPTPELVTVQSEAFALHQIVGYLKSGANGLPSFQKVIVVGHSLGSGIVVEEAGTYNDIDGAIITGFLHTINTVFATNAATDAIPAVTDPKFANSNLPFGYITTKAGTRGDLFYYLPTTDPVVLATDELTKDLSTDGEFATFFPSIFATKSNNITAPVLVVVGEFDNVFCGSNLTCTQANVSNEETPLYAAAANFQVSVVPDSGHDINLHTNAQSWFTTAKNWLKTTFDN